MKKYKIAVNENVLSYLERLHYEYETAQDNVAFLLANYDKNVLESDAFKAYEEKQLKAKIAYEEAKAQFTENHIPPVFRGHDIMWEIDFRYKHVIITQRCQCELNVPGVPVEVV